MNSLTKNLQKEQSFLPNPHKQAPSSSLERKTELYDLAKTTDSSIPKRSRMPSHSPSFPLCSTNSEMRSILPSSISVKDTTTFAFILRIDGKLRLSLKEDSLNQPSCSSGYATLHPRSKQIGRAH